MSDLIDRDEVIEIIESVCSADDSYWQPGTLEKIRNLPTHTTPSNTLGALDCVSRQDAIDIVRRYNKSHMILKGKPMIGGASIVIELEDLPSAQPEQLEKCPIYGGVCLHPSDQCYECPRHAGAERKTGHWVEIGDEPYDEWKCDMCGFVIDGSGCIDPEEYKDVYKFCPSCGADMRGEQDD